MTYLIDRLFEEAQDNPDSLYWQAAQQLAEANAKVIFCEDRMIRLEAKIADLTARLEAQEAREPVPVGYFLRGPDGYLEEVDNETSETIRLYTTPQPTPNVKAAVAAAYRKAAEVCDSITMLSDTDLAKKAILAIPHDDSALREICLKVEEELAEVLEVSCKGFLFETVVDRVLGEVKCS